MYPLDLISRLLLGGIFLPIIIMIFKDKTCGFSTKMLKKPVCPKYRFDIYDIYCILLTLWSVQIRKIYHSFYNLFRFQVTKEKEFADMEEEKVSAFAKAVLLKQRECEEDLEKAEPALLAAREALNTLNKVNFISNNFVTSSSRHHSCYQ